MTVRDEKRAIGNEETIATKKLKMKQKQQNQENSKTKQKNLNKPKKPC